MNIKIAVVMGAVLAGSVFSLLAQDHPGAAAHMDKKAALTQSVYVCPDCEALALKSGKCEKCGKDMVQKHLLGNKEGKAMLCDCAASCKCDAKGAKDGKCACGMDVKMMKCAGMYCCPEGCPVMSDKPGKCLCGKDMKQAE